MLQMIRTNKDTLGTRGVFRTCLQTLNFNLPTSSSDFCEHAGNTAQK